MFFKVPNKSFLSSEQLRTNTLLRAFFVIRNYPMHASDKILDKYIQQQYGTSLKNMCIKLLLDFTFYKDDEGNLILMFKNQKYDTIASLITYGNGAILGSQILKIALSG
jgi:hypothetical protein